MVNPLKLLSRRPRRLLLLMLIALILPVLALQAWLPNHTAQAAVERTPTPVDLATTTVANCRYGATPLYQDQISWVSTVGAGWYLHFGPAPWAQQPANASQFVPVIRIKQAKDAQGNYLPQYLVGPANLTGTAARDYIQNLVGNQPGRVWIVGNEVDRGPDPGQIVSGQGDVFPDIYAQAYHDVYHWIKEADPTAQVAISALVQVTPGRLQYLDLVWEAYQDRYGHQIPVDVWNMHLYILPEVNKFGQPNAVASVALGTDPAIARRESGGNPAQCPLDEVYCYAEHDDMDIFAEQIVAMRTWMKAHGQQNKPLILSEYSLLFPYEDDGGTCFLADENGTCFTPDRVQAFMVDSFDYLESASDPGLGYPLDDYRLVQQWMWFSMYTLGGAGSASQLLNAIVEPGSVQYTGLSNLGQQFQVSAAASDTPPNLVIEQVESNVGYTGIGGTASVSLTVRIRNNGNTHVFDPFTVTFYRDAVQTQPIGSVTVDPVIYGCASGVYKATVTWDNLAPGAHRFYVWVDSGNGIAETAESDNTGQGMVIIDPYQALLPAIQR
ncbi:MAG: hypothetical protein KC425_00310 [Anaerolineales bacterium]|nr:hypothetical protein [Anaerolineales bacterium]